MIRPHLRCMPKASPESISFLSNPFIFLISESNTSPILQIDWRAQLIKSIKNSFQAHFNDRDCSFYLVRWQHQAYQKSSWLDIIGYDFGTHLSRKNKIAIQVQIRGGTIIYSYKYVNRHVKWIPFLCRTLTIVCWETCNKNTKLGEKNQCPNVLRSFPISGEKHKSCGNF